MTQAAREAFARKIRNASMSRLDDIFYDLRHGCEDSTGMTQEEIAERLDMVQNEYSRRIK